MGRGFRRDGGRQRLHKLRVGSAGGQLGKGSIRAALRREYCRKLGRIESPTGSVFRGNRAPLLNYV